MCPRVARSTRGRLEMRALRRRPILLVATNGSDITTNLKTTTARPGLICRISLSTLRNTPFHLAEVAATTPPADDASPK